MTNDERKRALRVYAMVFGSSDLERQMEIDREEIVREMLAVRDAATSREAAEVIRWWGFEGRRGKYSLAGTVRRISKAWEEVS